MKYSMLLVSLLSLPVYAGNPKSPPVPVPADIYVSADARSNSDSNALAFSTAETGPVSALAGDSESVSTANASGGNSQSSSNSSADGKQSVNANDNSIYMVMPSLIVQDCGSGLNAGAAKNGDMGFLGFVWTTGACYAMKSGASFVGIGDYESACVLWYDVNRRAFKRQNYKPDCHALAERMMVLQSTAKSSSTPPDMSEYVTRKEMIEREERIIKGLTSK